MELDRFFSPRRVHFLDEARGFCLLLMIAYHAAYDIAYVFGWDIPAFHWPVLAFAQPFVAGIFILISGVCCRYSKSNLRRGLLALALGLTMSLFTWKFMPSQIILFGILHFLGCSMVLFALSRHLLDKLPVFFGILLSSILFAATWSVPSGWLGFSGLGVRLPHLLYQTGLLFPLGFPRPDFFSADYFPLLPWLFCFLAGSYLGVPFVQRDMPAALYRGHARPLAWLGRHSLAVYLFHQPVVYGLLAVLFRLPGLLRGGA